MIIPGALFLASIVCNNSLEDLFCAIIIGVMSLVAAFSYFTIRQVDEKNAITASLAASISLSVLSFLYCLNNGSGYWIPIILAGIIVLVFGYASKKLSIIDWGYYLCAAGAGLMLSSLTLDSNLITRSIVNYIAWIIVPITLIIRDYIRTKAVGGYRKDHPQFIIGAIVLWLITANYANLASFSFYVSDMATLQDPVFLTCSCISIICQVGILLYAIYTRISAMKALGTLVLVYTVLSSFSHDIWACLLIVGISLIGFAIFAIYRATKNEQQKPSLASAKNTDIQVEKVNNPDKKTLA